MPDGQHKLEWLARWRAKRQPIRTRWWFNASANADSEEKNAERHTTRGEQLAAEDRRYRGTSGGTSGGLM